MKPISGLAVGSRGGQPVAGARRIRLRAVNTSE